MKNLSGKELMRGDAVLVKVGEEVIVGIVHEFYDRSNQVRVSGYNIRVNAADCYFAKDAWEAGAAPIIAKAAAAAAKAKADADAKAAADKAAADEATKKAALTP
jgi:ribosomal protein L24